MVTETELFGSPIDFCWWRWMKSEVYTRKFDKRG